MDFTSFYTLDTSSLLDMAFGVFIVDDASIGELMAHTCGLIRAYFDKASGLVCNLSTF